MVRTTGPLRGIEVRRPCRRRVAGIRTALPLEAQRWNRLQYTCSTSLRWSCGMLPRLSAILTFALLIASSAHATAPELTPTPKPPTSEACKAWAAKQDSDAIYMWGRRKNGESSREIALQRLTLSCLGHRPPEIVNFGSSAGFDEAYCRKHSRFKICKDVR